MFCAKCGAKNADTNKFCLGCGTSLVSASIQPAKSNSQQQADPSAVSPPGNLTVANVADTPGITAGKICPQCSQLYPPAQKFCNTDGAALVANDPLAAFPEPEPAASSQPSSAPAPSLAPSTVPPEPIDRAAAPTTVEPPALSPAPKPSTPELSIMAEAEGLACPKCGLSFSSGVRFCDQDGTTLVSKETAVAAMALARKRPSEALAAPPTPIEPAEPSWSDDGDEADAPASKRPVLIAGLAALALLVVGGGYSYWNGMLDRWIGGDAKSDLNAQAGVTIDAAAHAANDANARPAPGLLGTYKAHLADQDIALVINGDSARPLVTSHGTVTYVNVVNGGTCTALLVPESGGGVGGDTSNAVRFRQTPVSGKPNCPQDIPVRIDITGQPANTNGVISAIAVEWFSGSPERILMSGKLERAVLP